MVLDFARCLTLSLLGGSLVTGGDARDLRGTLMGKLGSKPNVSEQTCKLPVDATIHTNGRSIRAGLPNSSPKQFDMATKAWVSKTLYAGKEDLFGNWCDSTQWSVLQCTHEVKSGTWSNGNAALIGGKSQPVGGNLDSKNGVLKWDWMAAGNNAYASFRPITQIVVQSIPNNQVTSLEIMRAGEDATVSDVEEKAPNFDKQHGKQTQTLNLAGGGSVKAMKVCWGSTGEWQPTTVLSLQFLYKRGMDTYQQTPVYGYESTKAGVYGCAVFCGENEEDELVEIYGSAGAVMDNVGAYFGKPKPGPTKCVPQKDNVHMKGYWQSQISTHGAPDAVRYTVETDTSRVVKATHTTQHDVEFGGKIGAKIATGSDLTLVQAEMELEASWSSTKSILRTLEEETSNSQRKSAEISLPPNSVLWQWIVEADYGCGKDVYASLHFDTKTDANPPCCLPMYFEAGGAANCTYDKPGVIETSQERKALDELKATLCP